MKRAVTLVLLAATTALTVPAAAAQDSNAETVRAERRAERQANRASRQETRRQPSAPAAATPPQQARQVQSAPPVNVVQRRGRSGRDGPISQPRSQTIRDAWQGNPNDPARARYERQAAENAMRYGTRDQRREVRRDVRADGRDDRRDWRQDRRGDRRDWRDDRRGDRRDWRRDWRNDRRYDWNGYRNQNRFIFRLNPYYSPYGYGYGYRRFGVGSILESLFFGRNYWISDPWQYRLPPAPPGYQWVRYYNDVVLVDTYTGRIEDVIYDFFW